MSRSTASNTGSPAIGRDVTRDTTANRLHDPPLHGEDPFDVPLHHVGEGEQPGRLAVGAQSTINTCTPALDVRLDVDQGEISSRPEARSLLPWIVSVPAQFMSWIM